jgi:hypothetical protein
MALSVTGPYLMIVFKVMYGPIPDRTGIFHGSGYVNDIPGLKCKTCFSCMGVSNKQMRPHLNPPLRGEENLVSTLEGRRI